jgi:hypothetical protein
MYAVITLKATSVPRAAPPTRKGHHLRVEYCMCIQNIEIKGHILVLKELVRTIENFQDQRVFPE